MSNIKVKVNPSNQINVRVGQQPAVKIISNANSPLRRYVDLLDVDIRNLKDGDIAVYHSDTNTFVSQSDLVLDNLVIKKSFKFDADNILEVDGGTY